MFECSSEEQFLLLMKSLLSISLKSRGKSGKWTEEDRNKVDMDSVLEPEAKRSRLDGESSSNSASQFTFSSCSCP